MQDDPTTQAVASPPSVIHFVGVAGIGMSGLASLLHERDEAVSGSDRFLDRGQTHPRLEKLRRLGVALYPQDGAGVTPRTRRVVVSTAIEADNPDLTRARALGIETVHRSQVLAGVFHEHPRRLAVTGTYGKTTVTALIGWMLHAAGLRPTIVNGGVMRNFETDNALGNAVAGLGQTCVIEADESDGTCLQYRPTVGVVTGLARDHKEPDQLLDLYRRFMERTEDVVVFNAEDEALRPLARGRRALTYGCDADADLRPEDARCGPDGCRFRLAGESFALKCLGAHSVQNVAAAVAACRAMGVETALLARAAAEFRGVERRLECVASPGGVSLYDDYAHNPTKIAAAVAAVRTAGARRILAVFQPHGFGPARFMREELVRTLADCLCSADLCLLLPIYYAGGTTTQDISSEQIAAEARGLGAPAEAVGGRPELVRRLADCARPGDAVLVMGARDDTLTDLARDIAAAIAARRP